MFFLCFAEQQRHWADPMQSLKTNCNAFWYAQRIPELTTTEAWPKGPIPWMLSLFRDGAELLEFSYFLRRPSAPFRVRAFHKDCVNAPLGQRNSLSRLGSSAAGGSRCGVNRCCRMLGLTCVWLSSNRGCEPNVSRWTPASRIRWPAQRRLCGHTVQVGLGQSWARCGASGVRKQYQPLRAAVTILC